jgi:DNA replication protein DnaC
MLTQPLFEKLHQLGCPGMLTALKEQLDQPEAEQLGFTQRLGLLIDREWVDRENRRLTTRLAKAKLRQNACVEDVDFRHRRGLDQALFMQLAQCRWIKEHHNVLIVGPTGVGKTYLACALAHTACRQGYSALYLRLPRLLQDLGLARGDGRYANLLKAYARTELLLLDDWGLKGFTPEQQHDILDIIEDRHNLRSTLITSQLPVDHWHQLIADPTVADAILDRLVHNAYRITLKGDSLRKTKNKLTYTEDFEKH